MNENVETQVMTGKAVRYVRYKLNKETIIIINSFKYCTLPNNVYPLKPFSYACFGTNK